MSDKDAVKEMVAERNAAFERDDIAWAARMLPDASCPEVVEMAFHKARLECLGVSEIKRRESQSWLADRNLTNFAGDPVSKTDPLPV